MTNDQQNCKLSLAITKPGRKTNRLTAEITQEQAQKLLQIIREVYAPTNDQ